ncbi:MAG: hypothetical protein ACE5OZ_01255 [Candidatus Heimdallarchaeota archaeon]
MALLEQIQETIAHAPELQDIQERLNTLKDALLELEGRIQTINTSHSLTVDDNTLFLRLVKESRVLSRERIALRKQVQRLADQNAPEVLYFEKLLESLPPHIRVAYELKRLEERLAALKNDEPDDPPC